MAFQTLSGMLGSQFGGKTYTSSFFGVRLDFGPRQQSSQPDYTSPSSPSPTPTQQTLPTSKYGDTIPVVYGICRVPGAYIWAPDFVNESTSDEVITTLRARVRFARPLVANSNWALRRLWSNGKLIYRGSAPKYRSRGLTRLRAYDGQSTQSRDDLQVEVEGEDNVSAHRGYLDMVITLELTGEDRQPPSFDAEWVQDAESSVELDAFEGFTSDPVDTMPALVGSTNRWYGISGDQLRLFNTDALHELYAVPVSGASHSYFRYGPSIRYIETLDLILTCGFVVGIGGGTWPLLINPTTGVIVAEADLKAGTEGQSIRTDAAVAWGSSGLNLIAVHAGSALAVYYFDAASITRVSISGNNWDSRGEIGCITIGEKRTSDADVFICAGSSLYKVQISMFGAITSATELATFSDELRYAVYYEGDVVVWDDTSQITKVDGTTGATIWSVNGPYTVPDALLRGLTPPDANRLVDEFYIQGTSDYYFTSLLDGSTRTIAHSIEVSAWRHVYDATRDVVITTDNDGHPLSDLPLRRLFDAIGPGTTRDLEDFVSAVWEAGEAFSASEHEETGYSSDQIKGAVIDITTGQREVIRSVAGPYSFSIFERAGKIVTKRAFTDGSFVVDATLSSTDFADRGGQAIRATKINPEEFIARYGIVHRDPEAIYQPLTQYGEIQFRPYPVSPTDLSVKVDIPIIHSATAMKTLATKKVQRMAEEKHDFSFQLKAAWVHLEPEDIPEFQFAGRIITARLTETTVNPDFTLDCRATEFLSKVDTTVEGAINTPTEPGEVGSPESTYYHLDIPLLAASDDLAGAGLVQYHVLTSQGQDNWDGATLYRDNVAVASQNVDGLVGVALTALPDWDIPYATEFERTINVAFLTGDTSTLASATYNEVCAGANMFAIGQPGRWEVCHVIDIADNGDGSFAFTGLRRGRGTSEEFTALHEVGDLVVWLGSNVQKLDYAIADLNDSFAYKAVGEGGTLSGTTAVSRTVTGEAEKIPKPAHLEASIDSPSNVTLSWVRRSRIGAFWAEDGEDTYTTPLGESLEQYVIRIKDGPGGTVLRTVTVNDATTYEYPGDFQTTDFGSPLSSGDDLTWDIRQVSGTGVISPTREETITL